MIEPDHLLGRNSTDAEEVLWTKKEVNERIARVETNMCFAGVSPLLITQFGFSMAVAATAST
jgi:hypothetical protein